MPDPRHLLGVRGEEAAARWLVTRGWVVLARRWRASDGELDLVCRDPDGMLVGVEVKLRSTGRAGAGAESVDARRVVRLRHVLATYAATRNEPATGLRLDLVTLTREGSAWRLVHQRSLDGW